MQVITTIIPIFIVTMLGWVVRKRGFITAEFLTPANRLVYYLSIPAMVFNAIAKASFHEQFDLKILLITLLSAVIAYVVSFAGAKLINMSPTRTGAFVQSSGHGNLGYFGLPIAFYYLGEQGFVRASILCGFLMILQNLMSVITLQLNDTTNSQSLTAGSLIKKLIGNPVIIGAMGGIFVSALEIPVPAVIDRTLTILGGLAPPMALLLIGASISMQLMRKYLRPTLGAVAMKILFLPGCGWLLFSLFGFGPEACLPAIILLASPTATIAYVMAREMHGDADFAVATISASTLFSSATYMLWLALLSGHIG